MKESQIIEWKPSWRDEYLRWICGFANAEGGVLVIGRDDAGKVIGVEDAARLLEEIPNKVRDILGIMVDVNLRRNGGKELVEIRVEPYPSPISYKGEYHYRSGSTKQELKGSALEQFLLKKRGRHWDDVPEPSFTPRACSASAMRLFKERATESGRMGRAVLRDSREVVLANLELIERHGLKRAACLLFSNSPGQYVTGAWIKIGFFVTDDDLRYQDEVQGNLFEQVEKALDLLHTKYFKAYITYQGLQRRERPLFPEAALREALLNAVVHKDYSSGIPIQISVYEDRIVFWNPGNLPEHWTLKELLGKHPSRPFNPLLANAFFRAGYIEAWGRGIEKILRECKEHGTDPPIYDYRMSGLMLTFRANPAHLQDAAQEITRDRVGEKVGIKVGEKVGEKADKGVKHERVGDERVGEKVGIKVGEKVGERLNANQRQILGLLLQQPQMVASELAEIIGISKRKIEQNIATLKKMGRLKRVGPDKGGHWEVVK
jgi:ATP-dependent DNA helicase RecG